MRNATVNTSSGCACQRLTTKNHLWISETIFWTSNLLDPIWYDLDDKKDAAVIDWFYDERPLSDTKFVNGTSYKTWRLPVSVMSNLHRLSERLLGRLGR